MTSIIISSMAILISIYGIYLTHLKNPDIKFYTDEKVQILSMSRATGEGIKLKLNMYNSGASVGEVTDLILIVDEQYVLCPDSRKNKLPINVEDNKYKVEEIKFNPIKDNKESFSVGKLNNGNKHTYSLYARLNGQEDWEAVLQREFIENNTVLFMKCRDQIINDYIEE